MNASAIRRRGAVALAVGALVVTALPVQPSRAGQTPSTSVRLVSQSTYLPGDEGSLFRLSLVIENPGPAPVLTVSSHRTVDSRDAVRSAAAGALPRIVDTVRIDLNGRVGSDGGQLDVIIASEDAVRTPEFLQFPTPGLYPLTVGWERDGEVVGSFVTFIERLPAGVSVPAGNDGLRLAVIGRLESSITLQPDSTTIIDPVDRQAIIDTITVLETLPDVPITVSVRPELIDALDRADDDAASLLARLQNSSSLRLVSSPFVDVDPADLGGSGTSGIFRRQLRLGEDVLAGLLPTHISPRLIWLQSDGLTDEGGVLLAELGLRNIVLDTEAQETTADGAAQLVDSTRKVELRLSDDTMVTAALVDTHLSEALTRSSRAGGDDPALVAQHVLAELKALLLELESANDSLAGRGLLMSTVDGSLPSPDMLTALQRAVADDPRLIFVAAENLVTTMSVNLVDGRPVVIDLLRSDRLPDPSTVQQLSDLTATVDAFSSMLPSGDFRPRRWRRLLDVFPHRGFTADQRQAYAATIADETRQLSEGVLPPAATTFTLGGRDAPLRFSVRNDGDTDVRVLIRLTSAKLTLPEGDKVVSIPARSSTAVDIPVVARSNGRFPVSLQLLTPDGGVQIGPVARLTARVNALAGLGQLVTGIAVLLLLSWWISHFRRQHRQRRTQDVRLGRRHPSEKRLRPSD
ncbi:MAG: DUF6049 family protein [Actinomycetota bacterium]